MAVFLVDLDGTLADDRARKLKAGPEPDRDDVPAYQAWLGYIQSEQTLAEDHAVHGMSTVIQGINKMPAIIIYLTSREDKYREVTRKWLSRNGFPSSLLLMRQTGSWKSTRELKEGHIRELQAHYKNMPFVAIDDDGSGDCAQLYQDLEIPHLHVKLPPLPASASIGPNYDYLALQRTLFPKGD